MTIGLRLRCAVLRVLFPGSITIGAIYGIRPIARITRQDLD